MLVAPPPGVSPLPPPSAAPFALAPAGAPRGVALCLHGYSGTPYEVKTTALAFAAAGFRAVGPLLRGHGTDPAQLNRVTWRDWVDDAVAAYDRAVADAPGVPVVVVGCSMGGLVSLLLSTLRPVRALVLLAPALRFFPSAEIGAAALTAGLWQLRPFFPKEGPGGDVGAADGAALNPTYKVLPARGIIELWRMQRDVEARLKDVTAPVIVFHGRRDHTIAPVSSEVIARHVQSPLVEHHRLARTQHLVALDVERDAVNAAAVRFVDDVLGAAR